VERVGNSYRGVWHATVKVAANKPLSAALIAVQDAMEKAIGEHRPDAVSVEGIFFYKFARTAMLLGHARGVVIATCAKYGLPVYEYAPRDVKQAMTGYGAASKEQMQRMMMSVLKLDTPPAEDEGDALGLALCHLQHQTGIAALRQESI